jgi:hypothetical protein
MKKFSFYAVLLLLFSACSEKATEDTIDCVVESFSAGLNTRIDGTNKKMVILDATYTGSLTFKSVTWEFGDGQTVTTTTMSTTHTFTTAGTYKIKAKIKLTQGSGVCIPGPEKTVTIN